MSEDRTQAPTKRRRQLAKERGQVARSPELTAAVGLLATVALLGAFGGDLVAALVAAVRAPWLGEAPTGIDLATAVGGVRRLALSVARPLGAILGGVVVAIVAAHQAQVGGLWAPGLLAPDPARLWGGGAGLGSRVARGAWALAKVGIIAVVAAWAVRSNLPAFARLGTLDGPGMARAVGGLMRGMAFTIGAAILALGLIDHAWQTARLEVLLRTTPEEHREDQRAIEGDPALRSRRQRIARSWRTDPREALAGAALVLTGGGLAIVLAGGGSPRGPRRAAIRLVARGPSAARIRQEADRAGVPQIDAPDLARRLACSPGLAPTPQLAAELAAIWPQG